MVWLHWLQLYLSRPMHLDLWVCLRPLSEWGVLFVRLNDRKTRKIVIMFLLTLKNGVFLLIWDELDRLIRINCYWLELSWQILDNRLNNLLAFLMSHAILILALLPLRVPMVSQNISFTSTSHILASFFHLFLCLDRLLSQIKKAFLLSAKRFDIFCSLIFTICCTIYLLIDLLLNLN